ncbi:MAG: tRNA (adenosine(37)-N6)-dimethylallyltransferase MiaA [Armatimonadaceae bacterium]
MAVQEPPLLALVGPTAVGKTAVGIALAQKWNGEIISADAVAVYRGLDIGSAKPDAAERQRAVFHLIDVAAPDEDFTVADFARLAEDAIADIRSRNRVPILVGGTGLYVRSVTATLSMPEVPPQPELREALWAEVQEHGAPFLHERLRQRDPVSAQKILPGDAKRIIRALEVYSVTGQPLSAFHTPEGVQGVPRPNTVIWGLGMERERLYARIEARMDAMVAEGFVAEVERLLAAGYGPELKAMQSLGYRHIAAFLRGDLDWETAIFELKRDTRRYAKRQISWFRADPRVQWLNLDRLEHPQEKGIETAADSASVAPRAETAADAIITALESAER